METNTLQTQLISKVKAMSDEQLAWLERVLNSTPFTENEAERDLMEGIMILQDTGGAFDFLHEEPENYSIADCQLIYDAKTEQLVRNYSFKPGMQVFQIP